MASQTFTSGTIVTNAWFVDVNSLVWGVFNGATTAALARTALGLGSLATLNTATVGTGGTGLTTLTTSYGVVCAGTTATGNLQNAGAGTSGQVLTSNGAAALPSFQAPASGWVLIGTPQVASSSATIDFTSGFTSTYDVYVITFTDVVPATNSTNLLVRYSQSGSFSSATSYGYAGIGNNGTNGTNTTGSLSTATAIQLTIPNSAMSNTVSDSTSGEFYIFGVSNSTTYKKCKWNYCGSNGTVVYSETGGGLFVANTNAIDGIRFLMTSGNIASGIFTLYGVKKT